MQNHIPHFTAIFSSPLGPIGIKLEEEQLVALELLHDDLPLKPAKDAVAKKIVAELEHYFDNPKHQFDVIFHIAGTPFQQKVWRALQSIPTGKTLTYGELAKQLKTGPRAIGAACRTNPIPLIIPCHRIVGANHLGGYSGARYGKFTDAKAWLLQHESATLPKKH